MSSDTSTLTYDFRDPSHLYEENGIIKSQNADMLHRNTCHHCRKENLILVNNVDYSRWAEGKEYAQNVFTWLNHEDREILITGIHPKCWLEMFPYED